MIGIYKITSPTKKVYIGQSVNIERRFKEYEKLNCKGQTALYRSFLKHGIDKHKFEILCKCDVEELNDKERYYQEVFSVIGKNGLNCVLTKSTDRSGKLSEETKLKISESKKGNKHFLGKKHSQESKLKMSAWQKGRKLSEEHIKKMSKAQIGNKHSEETKLKMSESHIGKKASEETILRISLANTGKKRTEESKLKMSKAQIGKKLSKESKLKMSKAKSKIILNLETGIFYLGAEEASITININKGTLIGYLNGRYKNKTPFIYV